MAEAEDTATSLIRSVYQDVWDEFYAWEQEYCASEILSLQCDIEGLDMDDLSTSSEAQPTNMRNPCSFFDNTSTSLGSLTWAYSKEKIERRESSESTCLIEYKIACLKAPKLKPTPSYESCSPSRTSVFVGDDSDDIPFVPHPRSSFDFAGYRACHSRFAWEKERLDPDRETIVLESINRLNAYHGIPLEQIKRNLMPNEPLSKLGLRDLLQWTPLQRRHDEIPASFVLPERSDVRARFEGLVRNFCPNLNCIEAFCALHELVPPRGPQKHSTRRKANRIETPCGPDCYMTTFETSLDGCNEREVDGAMRDIVATIRSICPDLTVCQLAVACNQKCRETHAISLKLDPREHGKPSKRQHESGSEEITSAVIEKLEHFTLDYEPGLPCVHSGPCDKSANCPCYFSRAYCEKGCRCSLKCMRRFHGCKCKATRQFNFATCSTAACPCLMSGRECDPEVCKSCKTELGPGGRCFNSQIQRGETKKTAVKQSKYGLGLFLSQMVHKGELILEYTGEIIYESTVDTRAYFNEFRGRNYFYKLNNSVSIDATKLGNESRFINHDRAKVNCRAKYMLVSGVQRIGIYALKHLKPGTELHLDYGDDFFQNTGPA